MAEANCKRELELEIPADNVRKATEKIAKDLARVARVPGFRPGKAPVTLIRRRFADDIQGEVVQSLVPEYLEKALGEKNLIPVTRPEVDKVEFKEGDVLKITDVSEANVVCLYLFPEVNERLKPMLQRTLRPGSRVVSHDFLMGDDWKPEKTVTLKDEKGEEHAVYLWTIKDKK